ncbi:hypothetical protein BpHYR1_030118 [Brachionus plicatilis]|uniref:Uncharacterized protein n=1 Tax=Brachionus plicatilis TaxID=10195 RepID=A0A3M7RLX8_BRAPC|nr:hypothetical protein BpHYR1_030118 [Brachionus plicatilis]
MNSSTTPMWSSLLPPVCDPLWFTADCPKSEETELAFLEEQIEQEKMQLKEQSQDWLAIEQRSSVEQVEDEQDFDETEDDSYMGDANSDDGVDVEPQTPTW